MQILIGHIFGKIQSEEIVTRATGVAFLAEQGWPTVTEHTMGNYYARHHIVQRTGKKKNAGYKIDLSAMPQDYMDYLKECRLQGWLARHLLHHRFYVHKSPILPEDVCDQISTSAKNQGFASALY